MQPTTLNSIMSVSQNGVDVNSATGPQVIFSSQYPFAKLDKTNTVSFQNISLLFNREPPNPNGTSVFLTTTLVYQFPHGYKYIPSTWFLMENPTNSGVGLQPAYQEEGGIIIATDELLFTAAVLRMQADATNIYFYVDKFYTAGDSQPLPNIQGFSLNIRVYVFVGDLTGTTAGS